MNRTSHLLLNTAHQLLMYVRVQETRMVRLPLNETPFAHALLSKPTETPLSLNQFVYWVRQIDIVSYHPCRFHDAQSRLVSSIHCQKHALLAQRHWCRF